MSRPPNGLMATMFVFHLIWCQVLSCLLLQNEGQLCCAGLRSDVQFEGAATLILVALLNSLCDFGHASMPGNVAPDMADCECPNGGGGASPQLANAKGYLNLQAG